MPVIDSDSLQRLMLGQAATPVHTQQALTYGNEYVASVAERNVAPTADAVTALSAFDEPLPETVSEIATVLEALHDAGSPATMAQTGGRFFGLVNGGMLPVCLAARILADCWDQNAVVYPVSPISAKLEQVCEAWLRDLFGLPEQTVAGFVSGSSMAIVCGLAAARWRLLKNTGVDVNRAGLADATRLRVVCGEHIHSTVLKAVGLLGFGTDNIEWVPVDTQGRLRVELLPALDARTLLILQAGNVNTGSFDPIADACVIASKARAWVHIDGAFGLWAAASNTLDHLTKGLEFAQSWSVDAHKTLNTPYDNGIVLCADPQALVCALQNSAAYIMTDSEQRDGMLYTPEMSRRARAIELWAALKFLGRAGVSALVEGLHAHAQLFANELQAAGFTVLNDIAFNQVLLSVGDEAETKQFVERVQQSGECWLGGSQWFGKPVVRVSVCSWRTTARDVARAVAAMKRVRDNIAL
jgi:glutamate/tyrosine decarboxylase-like PLP-dependent enzyme